MLELEPMLSKERQTKQNQWRNVKEIFLVATKLGLTSFGGPVAHLGYFHNEYVRKRKWLDDQAYADLVALCQFLPGPASSQAGIGIGVIRGGIWGGVAAWIGFTLPSVLLLACFASFLSAANSLDAGWIHGLKIVAVAIVVQAVLSMGQKLAPDRIRATIAMLTAAVCLMWPTAAVQVLVILLAGAFGCLAWKQSDHSPDSELRVPISRTSGLLCLLLFFALLVLLPILSHIGGPSWISLSDHFYRAGSLVFGGGHVVLPLLDSELVRAGYLSKEQFLAGYGAAQAVPGPLFTFAGYLGAMIGGWSGALFATIAMFLPAFLLVIGTLPFWHTLRKNPRIQGALRAINAAVVGILLAALYHPIWTSSIQSSADFALAGFLFCLLVFWKTPPWIVVIIGALGGWMLPL
ncbi:chromate transporter [Brevibacillus borstelensis AK1]|uniref:Chromate transporter n=1 Tax=Brevibacillus borstelensis AK1 TaxID=1300222 RepID=M8DIX6_9BACL|nr:chromate transporter [Brevibacillus borstelensis]EMT53387.1 chromate transporter [Brevibacillus borstelensis AK1]